MWTRRLSVRPSNNPPLTQQKNIQVASAGRLLQQDARSRTHLVRTNIIILWFITKNKNKKVLQSTSTFPLGSRHTCSCVLVCVRSVVTRREPFVPRTRTKKKNSSSCVCVNPQSVWTPLTVHHWLYTHRIVWLLYRWEEKRHQTQQSVCRFTPQTGRRLWPLTRFHCAARLIDQEDFWLNI